MIVLMKFHFVLSDVSCETCDHNNLYFVTNKTTTTPLLRTGTNF